MTERMTTIEDDSVDFLISQYKGKTNIEKNLKAVMGPVQTLHDDVWDIKDCLTGLDSLTLYMLDIVAGWVGTSRQGRTDAELLREIKIQIAINTSSGTWDEIENAVSLITGATWSHVIDLYNCSISIFCNAEITELESDLILAKVKQAKAGGVGVIMSFLTDAHTPFGFGEGFTGFPNGYLAKGI